MKDPKNKIKVGFTTGDMNGIGPEILLNSLKNTELLSLCTPVIYGPVKNLNYTLNHLVERIKIYNEENFEYKIITVDFK